MKPWKRHLLGFSAAISTIFGASHAHTQHWENQRMQEQQAQKATYEQRLKEVESKTNSNLITPAMKGEFVAPVPEPDDETLKKMENTPPTNDEIKAALYYAKKFLKYKESEINPQQILDRVRNQNESIYMDNKTGFKIIDLTKINPNLSKVISDLSERYGRNGKLMHAIALVESAYGRDAVSKKGAKTPFQVMPEVKDHHYPDCDDDWCYYKTAFKEPSLYEKYFKNQINLSANELNDIDIIFAAASYNAGMGRLKREPQEVLFGKGGFQKETQPYILRMLSVMKHYKFKVLDKTGKEKLI